MLGFGRERCGLSRNKTLLRRGRHESKRGGAFVEVAQLVFAVAGRFGRDAVVDRLLAFRQQGVDQARQFVSAGGEPLSPCQAAGTRRSISQCGPE